MDRELTALSAAVAVNLIASLAHGAVHGVAGVPARPWQLGVVGVGLIAAPVAGLLTARRGRPRAAAALVAAGAGLVLAMEGPWHFLLPNPDHVAHAGGGLAFAPTAALTTAGDLLVVVVAGRAWRRAGTERAPETTTAGTR